MEIPLTQNIRLDREPLDLKGYEQAGGYQAVRRALKDIAPGEVTQVVKDSRLRGRGGAGTRGRHGAPPRMRRRHHRDRRLRVVYVVESPRHRQPRASGCPHGPRV